MLIPKAICESLTDQEIIQKSLAEVDYFSCLFSRYEPRLLRYLKRMADLTEPEAEDILQEAFIKIWKNLHAFDQDMKLSSWIYRIVHNEAISSMRKKKSFKKDQMTVWDESRLTGIPDDDPPHFFRRFVSVFRTGCFTVASSSGRLAGSGHSYFFENQ